MKTQIFIYIIFFFGFTNIQAQPIELPASINGMSFLGPGSPTLNIEMFKGLQSTNSNWVALIPEATLERKTLKLKSDKENKHWGETIEAQIKAIQLAKEVGLNVMLKPHIVLERFKENKSIIGQRFFASNEDKTNGAVWRGDFKASTEADWKIWEESYTNYILRLATIADSMEVELFCVGTELRGSVVKRPNFWEGLIQEVRNIYAGAITYSANWDEYDKVTFWNRLDYIGIDAYFPINFSKTPSVNKTIKNWKPIKEKLEALSQKENRKILMTEFGYKNVSFAGALPWTHHKEKAIPNNKAQRNLYEAFFESFWEEDWIAGGFSWNWIHTPQAENNTDFSIQNKPALDVLKKWYNNLYY